jgi:hypothetical protein
MIAAVVWHVSPDTVTVLLSVLIPIVTAAVTKSAAPKLLKGCVSLLMSAIVGLFSTAVTASGADFSQQTLFLAAISFVIQLASYLGFYKPVDINNRIAPTKGLG